MCIYTRDGIYNYNYHATLRLLEALLAPDFRRKSRAVGSCFMLWESVYVWRIENA